MLSCGERGRVGVGERGRVGGEVGGGALSMAEYKYLDFLQTDSIQEARLEGKASSGVASAGNRKLYL